jgi:hydrogenase nickel incorporation protein HypB
MMQIDVEQAILHDNDRLAQSIRARLDDSGVLGVNMMASPGAGKTSLILATLDRLDSGVITGVIEGDLASRIDADTIAARGIAVTQINTNGGCHLDARMIESALEELPIARLDLLIVENVGNLVCTANFALGTHRNVLVASVPEGHDKPFKYPGMFACADAIVLNKLDLAPFVEFDMRQFRQGVEMVNPGVPCFPLSCRTGEGLDAWIGWLREQVQAR